MILRGIADAQSPVFDSSSLLTVTVKGELRRLYTPFKIRLITVIESLEINKIYNVQSIRVSREGVLVYYILGKAYYYYNFSIE